MAIELSKFKQFFPIVKYAGIDFYEIQNSRGMASTGCTGTISTKNNRLL